MKYIILFVFTTLTISCQKTKMTLSILNSENLKNIPSASGAAISGNTTYIVGDDSPYLFSLNTNSKAISKSKIYSLDNIKNGRIIKKEKPDFEALEMINNNEIIVIGSGSKTPKRDLFLHLFLKDSLRIKTYQVTKFYNHLRESSILDNKSLNIEALAIKDEFIYFFNRGKNIIFQFNYSDLMSYLDGLTPYPEPKSTLFHLPTINGIESGFSGATILKEESLIIFTSSVEASNNTYNDGEILGSFIGSIDISNNTMLNTYNSVIIPFVNKPVKVESVTIQEKISPRKIKTILVTDNDKGSSLKIDCLLEW